MQRILMILGILVVIVLLLFFIFGPAYFRANAEEPDPCLRSIVVPAGVQYYHGTLAVIPGNRIVLRAEQPGNPAPWVVLLEHGQESVQGYGEVSWVVHGNQPPYLVDVEIDLMSHEGGVLNIILMVDGTCQELNFLTPQPDVPFRLYFPLLLGSALRGTLPIRETPPLAATVKKSSLDTSSFLRV